MKPEPLLHSETLPQEFYEQPTLTVARELLGTILVVTLHGTVLAGRIVETEAYRRDDPASHSFRGRTQRNAVMFGPPGRLYVYFTYGMHFCANVVTQPDGTGEAVLLRAVEPLAGRHAMSMRRKFPEHDVRLTNGPAKLCQAFGLTREQDGWDLQSETIRIVAPTRSERFTIGRSPRIGISAGREHLWRFFIKGNAWVSR